MQEKRARLLDDIGWRILDELQRDGRLSYAEVGRRVGLSTPAAAERVRRMEETGIITGYRATVDPEAVGRPLRAIVRVRANQLPYERARDLVCAIDEVLECHHVTGGDDLVMTVAVSSVKHLEAVLDKIRPIGDHVTSVILSTLVPLRGLSRSDGAGK